MRLCVTGIGTLTSLGQTAQSCAAYLAGLKRFQFWEDYFAKGLDEEFDPPEPIQVALAPLPLNGEHQWDRLVDLSLPAIEEALICAGMRKRSLSGVFFSVCLSVAPDKKEDAEMGKYYLEGIQQEGAIPAAKQSRVFFQGQAAGGVALSEAAGALRDGEFDFCLLGGADSVLDVERLDQLDRDFRLKSTRSPNGYIPGEASAFCVIERTDMAERRGAKPLVYLDAVGVAAEPHPLKDKEQTTAQGLTQAIRTAVAQSSQGPGATTPTGWVLSDFNGERHRAWEWGLVLPRLNALLGKDVLHWHPAECFGDVGAATTSLLITVAARAYGDGFAPRPSALILTASDSATRTAVIVRGIERN